MLNLWTSLIFSSQNNSGLWSPRKQTNIDFGEEFHSWITTQRLRKFEHLLDSCLVWDSTKCQKWSWLGFGCSSLCPSIYFKKMTSTEELLASYRQRWSYQAQKRLARLWQNLENKANVCWACDIFQDQFYIGQNVSVEEIMIEERGRTAWSLSNMAARYGH